MKTPETWKINLAALGISQFLYRAGTRSIIPFLPFFIHDLGKTNFANTALWSGWIFAAPFIVSFFTTPFWGSFGDKYGRKLMTLIAVFGFSASQLLMGISANLTHLLFFAALQEALGGFYPAAVSLTASNTPKEKTASALGILQFSNGAGNVVGPVIGGILADIFGYREVFYLVAATVSVSGFIILFFVKEKKIISQEQSYHSIISNWKHLFNKSVLLSCGLFLLIYSISVSMIRPTFSLFVQGLNLHEHASTLTGILLGIYGSTSAVASALFGRFSKRISLKSIFTIAVLTAAASSILIAFCSTIFMISLFLVISGFALGLMLPLIFTILSQNSQSDRKAGIFGVGSSFQTGGNLLGSALSGILVAMIGVSSPFITAGLLFLLIIPISKLWLKMEEA